MIDARAETIRFRACILRGQTKISYQARIGNKVYLVTVRDLRTITEKRSKKI